MRFDDKICAMVVLSLMGTILVWKTGNMEILAVIVAAIAGMAKGS